jgi:hypothetical protein
LNCLQKGEADSFWQQNRRTSLLLARGSMKQIMVAASVVADRVPCRNPQAEQTDKTMKAKTANLLEAKTPSANNRGNGTNNLLFKSSLSATLKAKVCASSS